MNPLKFFLLSASLTIFPLTSWSEPNDPSCVKKVFNTYCLGAPAAADISWNENGEHTIKDARGDITLTMRDQRIVAVSRRLSPANWLSFTDLKVKLVRLYSTATNTSEFPLYATSRSSKLNAIRAGQGFAGARWDQADWAVLLEWRSLDSMQLRYEISAESTDNASDDTLEGL